MGRLLAVPLAVRFSTEFLVRANLLGSLLSSILLLIAGKVSDRSARIAHCIFQGMGKHMRSTGITSFYPIGSTDDKPILG